MENTNLYLRAMCSMFPECKEELIKMDDSLRKTDRAFDAIIASSAKPTGLKSKFGNDIKVSYIPWHNAFMSSKNRNNSDHLLNISFTSNAFAFERYNNYTKRYDYIVALNKDMYDHISHTSRMLVLSHELGHAIMDHVHDFNNINGCDINDSNIDDYELGNRNIDEELEADTVGFDLLTNYFNLPKSLYDIDTFSVDSMYDWLIMGRAMMLHGLKGVNYIQKIYNYKDMFETCKNISAYIIKRNAYVNDYETKVRTVNYQKWLKSA